MYPMKNTTPSKIEREFNLVQVALKIIIGDGSSGGRGGERRW
jgi:hypothetical protein